MDLIGKPAASTLSFAGASLLSLEPREVGRGKTFRIDLNQRAAPRLSLPRAEGFQIGDVGFVELRDVRDHYPVAMQVGSRDFLNA